MTREEWLTLQHWLKNSEFRRLLAECRRHGIGTPARLSEYIREHDSGSKYPTLSGTMDFSRGDRTWKMEGAISPACYRALCIALKFHGEGDAEAGDFVSYEEQKRSSSYKKKTRRSRY